MVDFNKKLKVDRINLFCDVVTKMAHGTPAEGYAIGDAIKQLPENLQQFLISEIPDVILRREYSRRELHKGEGVVFEGADTVAEVYKEEVFNANRAEAVKDLLWPTGGFAGFSNDWDGYNNNLLEAYRRGVKEGSQKCNIAREEKE